MIRSLSSRIATVLLLAPLLLVNTACSSKPHVANNYADDAAQSDPLEGFNRVIFKINEGLDQLFIRPAAVIYKNVIPAPVRKSVTNALNNAWQPITIVNSALQGDLHNTGESTGSFLVNSTLGIGGLFDVASDFGLHARHEDFGQTLGTWGVGQGFYLVLPLIGPSSLRDGVGRGVDTLTNPITWIGGRYEWVKYATFGAYVLDARTNNLDTIDNIYKTSVDPYAAIRSLYLQQREVQVKNRE